MEMEEDHYLKLIEDYKEKYLIGGEGGEEAREGEGEDVGEEQTDVNTASVFTDSFSDSLRTDEKHQAQLLDNLLVELHRFAAEEEADGEEVSDAMVLARTVEENLKRRRKQLADSKEEESKERSLATSDKAGDEGAEEEIEEEEVLAEDILEEEAGPETVSRDDVTEILDDMEKMDEERTKRENMELLRKRIYVYQTLDSVIPEYEEELSHYLRDGEDMLLGEDVPNILRAFGANPTEQECRRIVDRIAYRFGGRISFIDFLVILADQMKNPYTTEDVVDAFRMMDLNDGGEIPVVILKEVLTTIGEKLTETEMEEMIHEGDPLKEGFIKYEEFVRRMDRNLYVAIPAKRKALIKLLRKEERRRRTLASEEGSTIADELAVEFQEEPADELFNI